mgnify:CR=1 FL=1
MGQSSNVIAVVITADNKVLFAQMIVTALFTKHRVLTQLAGHDMDVIKILPPLIIGDAEIEYFVRALDAVLTDAIAEAMDGVDHLYVSVDIDCLDPSVAPGTGTPIPGGLTYHQAAAIIRRAS